MSKHLKKLHTLLDSCDGHKCCVDDILYHDLEILQPATKLVVFIMPARHFDIEDGLTNGLQSGEVFLKRVFNLFETSSDIRTTTTSKIGYWFLLPF